MKGCFFFCWRVIRRGMRLVVISLVAVAAGYWLGRHSIPGSFSAGVELAAPNSEKPMPSALPKEMQPKHRVALLLQHGGAGPQMTVELYGLSADELKEVLKSAESWPGGRDGYFYGEAIKALAFVDPESAMAELLKQPSSHMRSVHISEAMAQWAKRDPAAAWRKWQASLAGYDRSAHGLDGILMELGRKDLPLAFTAFRSFAEKDRAGGLQNGWRQGLQQLGTVMGRKPETRTALMFELLKPENSSGDLLWNGMQALFRDGNYADPQVLSEALDWLDQPGITGEMKGIILSGILSIRIRKEDPATTAAWYLTLADQVGLPAHESNYQLTMNWARKDLNACGEWLNQQEPGPHLDRAIDQFSMAAAARDVDAAFAWSAKITDEPLRLRNLGLVWSKAKVVHSRQEMWQALADSPISPADRQKLEAQLPPWD
ncbi:MAG: hypothetical protein V4675_15465 [Verrucomicrobiota bacterium]